MHDGTPLNDMSFMQLRVSATDDSKSGTYVCHVTFSPHGRVDSNDLFIEVLREFHLLQSSLIIQFFFFNFCIFVLNLAKGASSSEDVNDEEEVHLPSIITF